MLPVSPLPQIDFPTIAVSAQLPGASAEIMAATVATPLERQLGRIAGVTEMTSTSSLGSDAITLQFDLSTATSTAPRATCRPRSTRARTYLPTNLPNEPDVSQGQPGRRADHDPRR